ncbi:MAG: PAS domain-containing protein [Candidatus Sericytochromatia bacterium]
MSMDEAIISAVMASSFDPCLYCTPLINADNEIEDFRVENLNSQASQWLNISSDITEHLQLRRDFPDHVPESIWLIYLHVMDSGEHKNWSYHLADNPELPQWEVRLVRLEHGLLLSFRKPEEKSPSQEMELQWQKILAEEAAEGMLDWELKTGYTRYSMRLRAMLGLGAVALPQTIQIFFNALSPAEAEPIQTLIWDAINGTETQLEHRTRFMHLNGSLITLLCSGRILRSSEGEALRVVYVFRDQTREAQLEDELQHQQELFQLFLDAGNDGFFDWNPQSMSVYFSSRLKDMLGYKNSELANSWSSWLQILAPENGNWAEVLNKDVQAQHLPVGPIPLKLLHKQGHEVRILLRLSGKRLFQGAYLRVLGLGTDLSCLADELNG